MKKIESLQIVRGLSAILVVIDHTLNQVVKFCDLPCYIKFTLDNAKYLGDIGVMMFFIISGLIMVITTENKHWDKKFAKQFLKKRFLRIYPIYWIFLTLIVALYLLGLAFRNGHYSFEKIIFSYLLLPYKDNINDAINPILPQAWTLIYEMFFYLLFTLAIYFSLKKQLLKVLVLIYLFLLICTLLIFNVNTAWYHFITNPILIFFIIGIVINKNIFTKLMNYIPKWFYLIIATLSIFSLIFFNPEFKFLIKLCCALSIFILLLTTTYENRLMVILGDASYSIYLFHIFFTLILGTYLKSHTCSYIVTTLLVILTITISLFAGFITYKYLEKKMIHKLNLLFINRDTSNGTA